MKTIYSAFLGLEIHELGQATQMNAPLHLKCCCFPTVPACQAQDFTDADWVQDPAERLPMRKGGAMNVRKHPWPATYYLHGFMLCVVQLWQLDDWAS